MALSEIQKASLQRLLNDPDLRDAIAFTAYEERLSSLNALTNAIANLPKNPASSLFDQIRLGTEADLWERLIKILERKAV